MRWLRRRKAAGNPLSRITIDNLVDAKLQDLRKDWLARLERYVDHVGHDLPW